LEIVGRGYAPEIFAHDEFRMVRGGDDREIYQRDFSGGIEPGCDGPGESPSAPMMREVIP